MRPDSIHPAWGGAVAICLLLAGIAGACLPLAPPAADEPSPLDYSEPRVEVVVEGLFGPIGLARAPGGGILVAEEGTGNRDASAGVSLITPDGRVGRLISGLPSSRDAGDLAGVPLVALAPDGERIYVGNFNQTHLWTLPLSAEQRAEGLALPDTPLTPADLDVAMQRLNNVFLVNPFDMTFDADGVPVVTDASGNGVARETPAGATRFFHRFDPIPNPLGETDSLEAVPTGIERLGPREYLVTLTGGCPYPDGAGLLVAVDEERNQRTLIAGLNMPIDVARGPDGTLWLLEFARFTPDASCFSGTGYQPRTGRLSRVLPDWTLEPVLTDLDFPGALLPVEDGSLYIGEVLPGRVLRVTFGGEEGQSGAAPFTPPATRQPGARRQHSDLDVALGSLAEQYGLSPFPGRGVREGETPLARLGQQLFFDPILSGDRNISCATCHHPAFAMADGRVLPIGAGGEGLGPERDFASHITVGSEMRWAGYGVRARSEEGLSQVPNPFAGQFVARNSPTILNSALYPVQFWDGRVEGYAGAPVRTLEREVNRLALDDPLTAQALFPITSRHEMAGATWGGLPPAAVRRLLVARLARVPAYREQFASLFGGDGVEITPANLAAALAAFERQLIFTESPWDHYLAGDKEALTPEQKRGALLFWGGAGTEGLCASCHAGDLLSDFAYHNLLVPQLGPGKGHGYSGREDWGRAGVTFDRRDLYRFRTPSLRNVELTAPYFHDGSHATLADAIRHHARIWDGAATYDPSANGVPPALFSSLRPFMPALQTSSVAAELGQGLPLTAAEVADLVAFLHALTDPAARDLSSLIPERVPSGLPLDPLE